MEVAANKCTSSTGCFDGHNGAPEQYRWHRPMWHVHGYSGSHWMLASGNYSLRITPAAARPTGIQTTINKYTCKAGHFDGHDDAPLRNRMHFPMEEVQSFTEATGRRHWASIMPDSIERTWLRRIFFDVFIIKTVGKGHGLMLRTLFLIGV
jgi:hypothetical protein